MVANSIPDIGIIPDNYTVATTEIVVPEIQSTWTTGIQTVTTKDDVDSIMSRQFSIPTFPNDDKHLERIDLGAYSKKYDNSFYYKVSSKFSEEKYMSWASLTNPEEDFLRWTHNTITYRLEKIYLHKEVKTITWVRPNVVIPEDENYPEEIYYYELSDEFLLPDIDAGEQVAAEVTCEDSIEVSNFTTLEDITEVTGTFLLHKRYIRVKLINPSPTSHLRVNITFYGEYAWNSQLPIKNVKDTRNLVHPISTLYFDRLKPPGVTEVSENFWNTTQAPPIIQEADQRNHPAEYLPGTGDTPTAPIIPDRPEISSDS